MVVIVEDDSCLREELEHTFIREGYTAVSISSFEEPEKMKGIHAATRVK